MIVRLFNIMIFIVFLMAACGLFIIKDKVGALTYLGNEINKQIVYEENTIHTLKAELAYLTSPDRLRKLASNYLGLENIKTSQMIKDPLIPEQQKIHHLTQEPFFVAKRKVKWRYKKAPIKYLQTVSHQR